MKKIIFGAILGLAASVPTIGYAQDVGCVDTTFRLVNDDKICIKAIKDPDIQGIACHLSYAKTGGIKGAVGLAEDPSRYSVACRQVGPIVATKPVPKQETVFKQGMSILFKGMHVVRFGDPANNSVVYLVYSEKLIEGSPYNSISSVPLMPWGTEAPKIQFK